MTWLDSDVKGQGHNRPLRSNLLYTISHELLERSWWNLRAV